MGRVFTGRTREIEQFKNALDRMQAEFEQLQSWAADVGPDFDPSEAPRDRDYPRVFLLHGIGGMGKTWLTRRFVDIVREEYSPPFHSVYLDVSLKPEVTTERQLLLALARTLTRDFRNEMAAFFEQQSRQADVEARVLKYRGDHREVWAGLLDKVAEAVGHAVGATAQSRLGNDIGIDIADAVDAGVNVTLRGAASLAGKAYELLLHRMEAEGVLTEDEGRLFIDVETASAHRFVQCLKEIATHTPLVIAIDTVETIVRLEPFVRDCLLFPCATESIIFVIVGRHDVWHERRVEVPGYRDIHKGFADVLPAAPVAIDVRRFADSDVRVYLQIRASEAIADLGTIQDLVAAIQAASGGVPLAVEMCVDALLKMGPAAFRLDFASGLDTPGLLPRERVAQVVDRFLRYCIAQYPEDLQRIYGLAVLKKDASEGAQRAVWALSPDQSVREVRDHLIARYSFMREGNLHDEIRAFARRHLLGDPSEEDTRRALGVSAAAYFELRWESEAASDPDVAERLGDERFVGVTLDYLNALFWADNARALPFLVQRWVEAFPFDKALCRRLLGLADEFLQADRALHRRDHRIINRLQRLMAGERSDPVDRGWLRTLTGREAKPRESTEVIDALEMLQAEGERHGWWHPIGRAILQMLIAQTLHRVGDDERGLDGALKSAELLNDLGDQESLRAGLADLCEEIGWSLGYVRTSRGDGSVPIRAPRAVRAYETTIRLGRRQGTTFRHLGRLYLELGDRNSALGMMEQSITIDPHDLLNWLALGDVYFTLRRFDEAIAAISRASELDPKNAYPHIRLGTVYHTLRRFDEAIAAFNWAGGLDPKNAYPHNGLGRVYHTLRRFDEAIAQYSRAIELDPSNPLLYRNRVDDFLSVGRLVEAEQDCLEAERLDPDHPYTYSRRAQILSARGDYEGSKAQYEVALSKAVDKTEFNFDLMLLLLYLGKADDALSLARERLRMHDGYPPDLHEMLGVLRELDTRERGLAGLSEAIALLESWEQG